MSKKKLTCTCINVFWEFGLEYKRLKYFLKHTAAVSVSLVGQLGFCLLVRIMLNGPKAIDG